MIVAHRGGAALWVENSLVAFRNALAAGYPAIEFDVVGTRDEALVVIHDTTLDRTTNGTGRVADADLDAVRRLRLTGADEPVPTLDELLHLMTDSAALAIVEIKFPADGPAHERLCARLLGGLDRHGLIDRTTISAFDWRSLATLRHLSDQVNLTGVIDRKRIDAGGGLAPAIERLRAVGAGDFGLQWTMIDRETVAQVRAAGMKLGAWTPNGPDELRRMADLGVDWIITDRPDLAVRQ